MTAKPRGSTLNRSRNSDIGRNQGQRWCQNAPTSRTDTQFYVHVKNYFKGDRISKPVDTNTFVNLDLQTDHDKTLGWSETSSAMK